MPAGPLAYHKRRIANAAHLDLRLFSQRGGEADLRGVVSSYGAGGVLYGVHSVEEAAVCVVSTGDHLANVHIRLAWEANAATLSGAIGCGFDPAVAVCALPLPRSRGALPY